MATNTYVCGFCFHQTGYSSGKYNNGIDTMNCENKKRKGSKGNWIKEIFPTSSKPCSKWKWKFWREFDESEYDTQQELSKKQFARLIARGKGVDK